MSHGEALTLYVVATGAYVKTWDFITGQSEKIVHSRYKTWKVTVMNVNENR